MKNQYKYSILLFLLLSTLICLFPPFTITIERGLEIMAEDEYLEITPLSVRIRKQFLNESERIKARNKTK